MTPLVLAMSENALFVSMCKTFDFVLTILLWACFKVLVIVVIVCKCLLISSICFFPPISSFYACCSSCFPPPSSTAPPLLVCSDAAPSTEAAAHGWYLSLLLLPAQHGILCMPAEYSTARNVDMHGIWE